MKYSWLEKTVVIGWGFFDQDIKCYQRAEGWGRLKSMS